MHFSLRPPVGCLAAWILVAIAGCSRQSAVPAPAAAPQAPTSSAAAPAKASTALDEVRRVSTAKLRIARYLPALDDGRVEIPAPDGWSTLPRDPKFLVRFFKGDQNGLPRLEITAGDKIRGGIGSVTEQNVVQFAAVVAAELQGKKLLEPVLPMVVGATACARYVQKVELKMPQGSVVAERQTLLTSQGNRTYTVQLLVLPNTLLADRDAAYTICGGLKFAPTEPVIQPATK